MDRLKKYGLPLLALALLVVLVESFRAFFMAAIIEPIAIMLWAVWRILASVDQSVYWLILIVICSILVMRLIPNDEAGKPNLAYEYTYRARNRVEYWKTLIADAVLGKEEFESLRDNLKKLLISVIPHVNGIDLTDDKETVEIEKVPLSPQARSFLLPSKETDSLLSIIFFGPRWLRQWAAKFFPRDTTTMDEILEWMEAEMEIKHDK